MLKYKVYRDSDTLRLRKIVIEIYEEKLGVDAVGQKTVYYNLLDRSRMFGGLLSNPRALARLERRINNRISKRIWICNLYKKMSLT